MSTLKELGLINDIPGFLSKNSPKWHKSLYNRWRLMWDRCNNSSNKDYKTYKDIEIDERYRYLSNYVDDISKLELFNKFCENPDLYHIDKDILGSRGYYFESLTITLAENNIRERNKRCGSYYKAKPLIAYSNSEILLYKSFGDATCKGFHHWGIKMCCRGKWNQYKGYKWYIVNYSYNKILRAKEGECIGKNSK